MQHAKSYFETKVSHFVKRRQDEIFKLMNFNYFAKSSIIDVLQDPKYTFATHSKYRVESV